MFSRLHLILLSIFSVIISCEAAAPLAYAPTPSNIYVTPKNNSVTLLDAVRSRPDLSLLAEALAEPAGFLAAFNTPATWKYTFLAPSNAAFTAHTGAYFSTFRATPKGKWWLGNIITHHYIPNTILGLDTFNETLSRLQTGTFLYVSVRKEKSDSGHGTVIFNEVARVVEGGIKVGDNGILHIIDRILDPAAQLYEGELPKIKQGFIPGSCSNPQLPYC